MSAVKEDLPADAEESWYKDFNEAREVADAFNYAVEKKIMLPRVCCVCKRVFVLLEFNINWYKDQGYVLPKRCLTCRQRRRVQDSTVKREI